MIDLEDQRAGLVDIDRLVNQVLRSAGASVPPQDTEAVRTQLQEILRTKRDYLDLLIKDYNTCTKTWFDLADSERSLMAVSRKYADFIDEHVLWVRSTKPLHAANVRNAGYAVRWLTTPSNWVETGKALAG